MENTAVKVRLTAWQATRHELRGVFVKRWHRLGRFLSKMGDRLMLWSYKRHNDSFDLLLWEIRKTTGFSSTKEVHEFDDKRIRIDGQWLIIEPDAETIAAKESVARLRRKVLMDLGLLKKSEQPVIH